MNLLIRGKNITYKNENQIVVESKEEAVFQWLRQTIPVFNMIQPSNSKIPGVLHYTVNKAIEMDKFDKNLIGNFKLKDSNCVGLETSIMVTNRNAFVVAFLIEYRNFLKNQKYLYPIASKLIFLLLKYFDVDKKLLIVNYFGCHDYDFIEYVDSFDLNYNQLNYFIETCTKENTFLKGLNLIKTNKVLNVDLNGVEYSVASEGDVVSILNTYSKFYTSKFNQSRGWTPKNFTQMFYFVVDDSFDSIKNIDDFITKFNKMGEKASKLIQFSEEFNLTSRVGEMPVII